MESHQAPGALLNASGSNIIRSAFFFFFFFSVITLPGQMTAGGEAHFSNWLERTVAVIELGGGRTEEPKPEEISKVAQARR